MSVVLQVFSSSFGGVYNIPNASDSPSISPDKFLAIGTPTNTKITFGVTVDGFDIKVEGQGDFQYSSGLPKNASEYVTYVDGSVSGFKIYLNNVLMESRDYSPSVNIKDEDLAYRDKTSAAKIYSGNDIFIGPNDTAKDETYSDAVDGFDGNDVFYSNGSGKNDDIFYGGNGIDTSVFRGNLVNYKVATNSELFNVYTNRNDIKGFKVIDMFGTDGTQQVSGVERLKFSDKSLALDLDQNAGVSAKILGAVFGKAAVSNKEYVGIGLDLLDKGMNYETLAGLALNAAKATTNDQIVTTLWTNVVGSAPSAADKAPFIKMLEDGMTPGALAQMAADTSINTNNINLVGLAQTGIEYTPVA
jgi:hypothetical protein